MGIYRSNIPQISRELAKEPDKVADLVRAKLMMVTTYINKSVQERTPVWSGLAIRNMVWTMNAPNLAEIPAIESGPEGEGRRGANAAAAQATFSALNFKRPFGRYFLSNAAHHIAELEAGQLPTPERSRVQPGGIFFITHQEVVGLLR